jgi:hypothetical protein
MDTKHFHALYVLPKKQLEARSVHEIVEVGRLKEVTVLNAHDRGLCTRYSRNAFRVVEKKRVA